MYFLKTFDSLTASTFKTKSFDRVRHALSKGMSSQLVFYVVLPMRLIPMNSSRKDLSNDAYFITIITALIPENAAKRHFQA